MTVQSLAVRQEEQSKTAMLIAQFLETHPEVQSVAYPGLPSHPQYELGRRQMRSGGGVLAFEVKGVHLTRSRWRCGREAVAVVRLLFRGASARERGCVNAPARSGDPRQF